MDYVPGDVFLCIFNLSILQKTIIPTEKVDHSSTITISIFALK
jgi:hypothetical protein